MLCAYPKLSSQVKRRITNDELKKLEQETQNRRDRIEAMLKAVAPNYLDEFERTQMLIEAAENSLEMARASGENIDL